MNIHDEDAILDFMFGGAATSGQLYAPQPQRSGPAPSDRSQSAPPAVAAVQQAAPAAAAAAAGPASSYALRSDVKEPAATAAASPASSAEAQARLEMAVFGITAEALAQVKRLDAAAVARASGSPPDLAGALSLFEEGLAVCAKYPSLLNNRAQVYQILAAQGFAVRKRLAAAAPGAGAGTGAGEEASTSPEAYQALALRDLNLAIAVAAIKPSAAVVEAAGVGNGAGSVASARALENALVQRGVLHRGAGRDDDAYADFARAGELGNAYAKAQAVALHPIARLNADILGEVMGPQMLAARQRSAATAAAAASSAPSSAAPAAAPAAGTKAAEATTRDALS